LRRCCSKDTDKQAAEALRTSVVAPAQRVRKQTTKPTPDGLPVHSSQTLLADLATIARNTITGHHATSSTHRHHQANRHATQSLPVARRQL
jgi:hypothetical protein